MNRFALITVLVLSATVVCTTCGKETDLPFEIEGLTLENFPLIDGSTSTDPLVKVIACKLLGSGYNWQRTLSEGLWSIFTDLPEDFVERRLKSSQTHNAFINLIDKETDMIFSARKMSPDEKAYATQAGVSLIETPIALDALVFIVNTENRIQSLTNKQIQDIYTGKITNWRTVGGGDAQITPYVRNVNSGSQELMESLVLTAEQIPEDFPIDHGWVIWSMMPLLTSIQANVNGLGYTIYYYNENIIRDIVNVKTIAVNGVYPDKRTIANRKYPYTSEVYVIIRSDLDKSSMAYKIRDLLLTKAGKKVIEESGYVPI